jgi:hypothetical protein
MMMIDRRAREGEIEKFKFDRYKFQTISKFQEDLNFTTIFKFSPQILFN